MLKVRRFKNALALEPTELRTFLSYKRVIMEYERELVEVMWTDGDTTPVHRLQPMLQDHRYKIVGAITRGPDNKYDYVVVDTTDDSIRDIITEFNRSIDAKTHSDHFFL